MPTSSHRARRLFAGLACAAALALNATPAPAQSASPGSADASGHAAAAPERYDILASCTQIELQLQRELTHAWWLRGDYGVVDVRFVVTDGQVTAVRTRSGLSFGTMGDVRRAVARLQCPGAPAGSSVYRMQVVFADPDSAPEDAAGAAPFRRIALVEMR